MDPVTIGTILTVGSAAADVISGNQQAASIKAAGRAQQQQKEYEALVLRQKAGQERAASQRAAIEEKKRGEFAKSRALAVGAASGGTTSDIYGTIADLGAQGRYNELSAIYQGEDEARLLESQANLSLYEGESALFSARNQARNARFSGYASAFGKAGSLFAKYAPSGGGTLDDPMRDINGRAVGTYRRG